MMRGMTLVEAMFSVAIFLIVVLGVFEAYRALGLSIGASEQRLFALEAVNERLEVARNTNFLDITSLSGTQSVTKGGLTFSLTTLVQNIDDPFDGQAPADTDPIDFKLVEVRADCSSCRKFSPIVITGRFAP